jgi:hypothetical protein
MTVRNRAADGSGAAAFDRRAADAPVSDRRRSTPVGAPFLGEASRAGSRCGGGPARWPWICGLICLGGELSLE